MNEIQYFKKEMLMIICIIFIGLTKKKKYVRNERRNFTPKWEVSKNWQILERQLIKESYIN